MKLLWGSNLSHKHVLILLLIPAVALRLFYVLRQPLPVFSPGSDAFIYDFAARQILARHAFSIYPDGSPTAFITPGYPLFLAALHGIFGEVVNPVIVVRVAQAILSLILIVAAYLFGRLWFDEFTGLVASAMVAFYPPMIWVNREIMTESVFLVLLASWAGFFALSLRRESGHLWAISGALLGLATLVRPIAGAFFVFVFDSLKLSHF